MDILDELNINNLRGVDGTCTPKYEVNEEVIQRAIAEIIRLRARAVAVSDGQSFGDVRAAIAASIAADA